MNKSSLQIIADMHQMDIDNNSRLVKVSPHLISAYKIRQGANISMGAEESVIVDLMNGKSMALLLIVDKNEFQKLSNQ